VLKSLHAAFVFEDGDHKTAIAELKALIANAPADAKTNAIKVSLARMLAADGDQAAATKMIDDVLQADSGQLDAMKLKAGWLIDTDKTGDALVLLRDALGQSPQDPALMTLMARAYERDGNRNLEADALLQAVNASNHAAPESLQYAGFLMNDAKYSSAESVLIDAVRVAPTNPDLLSALARTHLAMKDWARASQDINTLRALNTPATTDTANQLQAQLLQAQSRGEDLIAFLNNLANSGPASISADIALIRTQAKGGDLAGALTRSADLAAKNPDSAAAQLIHASVLGAMGRIAEEEPILRAMIAKDPKQEAVWNELYRLTLSTGDASASDKVLADALTALPDNPDLLWTKAGVLEKSGNVEGAIAIYEALYAKHSDSQIIANNLASLLATAHSDDASLQRAFTVARRLRDSKQPAFQDTYGWISYRLGDYDTAVLDLKAAAAGLPHDPAVQYHLAAAYAAQHQDAAALAQYKLAAQLIDPAHPPTFKAKLDAEIARLSTVTK
jgi:cellulose synthase operon protein C